MTHAPHARHGVPVIVVAGTHSGCGKTTATLGLMAALTARSLRVQPLKAGPDYIDPGLHRAVTGRPSWNLDGWMCGPEGVLRSLDRAVASETPPHVAVVEGVMGLFDGAADDGPQGSTAEIAALLHAPVLLVADVRGMARSAAALVGGYVRFDPALRFAGVICNRVGGPGHRDMLRHALGAHCPEAPLLGLLARDDTLSLPSRHLGLAQAHEHAAWPELCDRLARWFEAGVNVDALLERCGVPHRREESSATRGAGTTGGNTRSTFANSATSSGTESSAVSGAPCPPGTSRMVGAPDAPGVPDTTDKPGTTDRPGMPELHGTLAECPPRRVRIGIACDAAFSFLYPENLFLLEAAGAEPVLLSPLADHGLPPGLCGLLLPGGYPELHAAALAANAAMRDAIRALAASGRPVHGECGGFMYLMRSITDIHGVRHAMSGCLPADCRMNDRLRSLGYREAQTLSVSPFGPPGTVLRGHEFHYSHLTDMADETAPLWTLRNRSGEPLGQEGLCAGGASGSYVHVHFGSNPQAAKAFVAHCAAPPAMPGANGLPPATSNVTPPAIPGDASCPR